ncbi:MAG: CHRD domain-containing protein [Nocardioidaceae bacterium]
MSSVPCILAPETWYYDQRAMPVHQMEEQGESQQPPKGNLMPSLEHNVFKHTAVRVATLAASACFVAAALVAPASAGAHSTHSPGFAAQQAGNDTLHARLRGSNEVPGPGDPNGSGRVTIRLHRAEGKVCAFATWHRIGTPIAAHIHRGRAGVSGDVVVDLTGSVTGGRHCVHAKKTLITKIMGHPHRYYYNIHNGRYQAGAIRGQLR